MTPEERYRFDVLGLPRAPRVLSQGDIEALNVAVDVLNVPEPGDDIMSQRFVNHLTTARRFRDLLDHDGIFDIVSELCGEHVRLDHAYGIIMRPGTRGLGLHGGGTPVRPSAVLHGRRRQHPHRIGRRAMGARRSCCRPRWFLLRARQPQGQLPDAGARCRRDGHRGADVRRRCRDLHRGVDPRHAPWKAPQQRRTLLYKYSPGNSAWSHEVWPNELLDACTPRQRLMLQPPSVGNHRPVQ